MMVTKEVRLKLRVHMVSPFFFIRYFRLSSIVCGPLSDEDPFQKHRKPETTVSGLGRAGTTKTDEVGDEGKVVPAAAGGAEIVNVDEPRAAAQDFI